MIARYTQFKSRWKNQRSLELLFDFFSDIFTDFFLLSDQLSKSDIKIAAISPTEFFDQNDLTSKPCLIVIVGDAGVGKTPWVEQLIELLRNKGETVDGIISQKNQESENKWYHNLIRISTNEKRQLTTMDEIDTDVKIGKFNLYKDSIKWGIDQLISINNSNWVIIDEIGILEFDGGGFLPGLQTVVNNFNGYLVITVRSALLQYLDSFITERLLLVKSWQHHIVKL